MTLWLAIEVGRLRVNFYGKVIKLPCQAISNQQIYNCIKGIKALFYWSTNG